MSFQDENCWSLISLNFSVFSTKDLVSTKERTKTIGELVYNDQVRNLFRIE